MAAEESTGTVLVALVANLVIAVAKFLGGTLGGSAAMMAEGAHSVADTLNEAFLLTSIKRADRPADGEHPFGYGAERFFWSLLAAVGIFVAGAGFSVLEGVEALTSKGGSETFWVSYLVLGIAFLAEGVSWVKAVRQVRREAAEASRGVLEHVKKSSDPTIKTVAMEDSAALVGLGLAFVGILLHQLTGNGVFDAIASFAIGALLIYVAYRLGRDTKDLLIGRAAQPELRRAITSEICGYAEVDGVVDLRTMFLGPDRLLVAVRLDLAGELDSDRVEDVSSRIDSGLRERFPEVAQVFLDPTTGDARMQTA